MSSANIIGPKLQRGVADTQAAWQYALTFAHDKGHSCKSVIQKGTSF